MSTTVFDASATLAGTDDGNGNDNGNYRQLFTTTALSAATGNQIRLTFLFGTAETSETPAIDDVYVGQKTTTNISSDTLDTIFIGDQVHVTFNGGSTSVNGSAAGVVVSDWITLGQNWDATKGYMVAYHVANGVNCNTCFATITGVSQSFSSIGGTSTASQTTASPQMNGLNVNTAALISKIEIQAAAAAKAMPVFSSALRFNRKRFF